MNPSKPFNEAIHRMVNDPNFLKLGERARKKLLAKYEKEIKLEKKLAKKKRHG